MNESTYESKSCSSVQKLLIIKTQSLRTNISLLNTELLESLKGFASNTAIWGWKEKLYIQTDSLITLIGHLYIYNGQKSTFHKK